MPTGVELIAEERDRQINELGYDLEHDRQHDDNLAFAAACYASPATIYLISTHDGLNVGQVRWVEPWPREWKRAPRMYDETGHMDPEDRLDELAKAGALIAAEMDRIMAELDGQA